MDRTFYQVSKMFQTFQITRNVLTEHIIYTLVFQIFLAKISNAFNSFRHKNNNYLLVFFFIHLIDNIL